MKIKSKDIAEALGISTATVSLALNDKPGVNETTKKRVRDYLAACETKPREMGFVKWIIYIASREMFSGEVRTYFEIGYEQALMQLQRARIEVKLVYVYSEEELERGLSVSNHDGTAGIILRCDEFSSEMFRLLDCCKVPLVLEDSRSAVKDADVLNFNNRQAVWDGLNYLKELGMVKIYYIKNHYNLYNFQARRDAYIEYMRVNPELKGCILEVGGDLQAGESEIVKCMKAERPDAFFLEDYHISMRIIELLKKMGVCVPEELSLLGIDAMPDSVIAPYQLTHFNVPHAYRSFCTAKLLLERINEKKPIPGRALYLHEDFVEGESIKK